MVGVFLWRASAQCGGRQQLGTLSLVSWLAVYIVSSENYFEFAVGELTLY